MSKLFKYYKSNIVTGCRLADIDKPIRKDEVFYLDAHVASTSRSVAAAERAKWIIEITEKEASQYITLPHPKFASQITRQLPQQEKNTEVSVNNKINEEALKRQRERLKRIEEQSKSEVVEDNDEDSILKQEIKPGKDFNINLGAQQRIKNRQMAKKAKISEDKYLEEVGEMVTDSSIVKDKIQKQFRKTSAQRNLNLLVDKDAKSRTKEIISAQINDKLESKILEKRAEKAEKVKIKATPVEFDAVATPPQINNIINDFDKVATPPEMSKESAKKIEKSEVVDHEPKINHEVKADVTDVVVKTEAPKKETKKRGRPKKTEVKSTEVPKKEGKKRGRPKKTEVKS